MISTHRRDELANDHSDPGYAGRVAWTKGESNHEVANLLCDLPIRLSGDLESACVDMNVDIVVSKRFPRSDIVSAVVPVAFDADAITSVAVAVGVGPHSPLAVSIAERVAEGLGVPGTAIAAYRTSDQDRDARQRLGRLVASGSSLDTLALRTPNPRSIAEHISRDTLLVHGAGGGSFIERHLTGTGNRLTSRARGCVLVVRSSAPKCFQSAVSPTPYALAPELLVADALQVMTHPFAPVVSARKLLGIVRVETLVTADPGGSIKASIEPVTGLNRRDPIRVATFERDHFGPGPLPVVDDEGHLVGVIET
jgi:CBS domain-containing protein